MTPTEWREQQMAPPRRPSRPRVLQMAAVVVWLLLNMAGFSQCLAAEGLAGESTNQPATATNAAAITNSVISLSGERDFIGPPSPNTVSANATSANAIAGANAVGTSNAASSALAGPGSVEPPPTNAPSANATSPAASANAAAQPALTFKVDRYEVAGNTLLATNLISSVLAPYTGDGVDLGGFLGKVTNAMGALQLEYFHRGFLTVKVAVPHQTNTEGVVYLQVTEGKLAAVRITNNRYFSSNNIMAALPYVKTLESGDRILNSKVFQTELDRANSNPDRQISPEIRPGPEPGTSALVLDVKDRLPLHGRLDFDNYSPPGTPELRVNANVSYDNLWQLDHTLGLQVRVQPRGDEALAGRGHAFVVESAGRPGGELLQRLLPRPIRGAGVGGGSNCARTEPLWLQRDDEAIRPASGHRAAGVHGLRLPVHHRSDHFQSADLRREFLLAGY